MGFHGFGFSIDLIQARVADNQVFGCFQAGSVQQHTPSIRGFIVWLKKNIRGTNLHHNYTEV